MSVSSTSSPFCISMDFGQRKEFKIFRDKNRILLFLSEHSKKIKGAICSRAHFFIFTTFLAKFGGFRAFLGLLVTFIEKMAEDRSIDKPRTTGDKSRRKSWMKWTQTSTAITKSPSVHFRTLFKCDLRLF